MDEKYTTDEELVKAIAANDMEAWSQLVHQYHGRLLNYARRRVQQQNDAEDMVQETFTSFIKMVKNHPQGKTVHHLDNYLFSILRNTIVSQYRTRWSRSVSLLQDAFYNEEGSDSENAVDQIASEDLSVSHFVSNQEQQHLLSEILTESIGAILEEYKQSFNFRNLKICDLIFYSRLSSVETARILGLPETSIRVFKHRFLKSLNAQIANLSTFMEFEELPQIDFLSDIWQQQRFSCPKYSTLGNFILENTEPEWFEYIDFHLTTLGCHFCRASYKDLQSKQMNTQKTYFEQQIIASTIGFFKES